jgi:hypothetical protein
MVRWLGAGGVLAAICASWLLGCTYAHSRRIVLEYPEHPPTIKGWEIRPWIYAYEERIGVDTLIHRYVFFMYVEHDRPKDSDTLGVLDFVEFDHVTVDLGEGFDSLVLPRVHASWPTNSSAPYIRHALMYGESFVDIPLEATHITLKITAEVCRGRHFLVLNEYGVPSDTASCIESEGPRDTVSVSIPMVRKDSKRLVPFFMRWND